MDPQAAPRSGFRHLHRPRPAVHRFAFAYLLVVPVLLAAATATLLFASSDVNVALLYSQCHARARLPWLSHLPVIGAPACFLVSFFAEALAAARSFAVMAAVLSFVAGLLSVSTVEAARVCNAPAVLIAYPTGPWLVFNLLGGAVVWELVIIPAFFYRSKQLLAAAADHSLDDGAPDPSVGDATRHLAVVEEVVAIPVAVAVGFVLPSLLMLILDSPATILVWLFFPVYVSLVRQAVRFALGRLAADRRTLHLESHRPSLLAVYAVPVVCSVLSHGLLLWSLTQPNDQQEMTRSAIQFIEVDFAFIALTVLYWVLVEAGWKVALIMVGASLVLGPGAGVCLGWTYREKQFGFAFDSTGDGVTAADSPDQEPHTADEETPLIS